MEHNVNQTLTIYNQLYKMTEGLYHQYAKQHDVSDSVLWLLYALKEREDVYTQKDLCSTWYYPPQTLNSALKSLEKQGYLSLKAIAGNRKNKQIVLTEAGNELMERVAAPLLQAERAALQRMSEEERRLLLATTGKYLELLQEEVGKI